MGFAMNWTRRGALAMGLAAAAAPALAQAGPAYAQMAAFSAWRTRARLPRLPLSATVTTASGAKLLSSWLDGRPTVLALWATWCGPCLREKPEQGALAARLARAGSRTQILALQAYDDAGFTQARATLARLHAGNLNTARASAQAETGFRTFFGASSVDPRRISLPSLVLVNSQGAPVGRAVGALTVGDSERSYWSDEATFQFLMRFGAEA